MRLFDFICIKLKKIEEGGVPVLWVEREYDRLPLMCYSFICVSTESETEELCEFGEWQSCISNLLSLEQAHQACGWVISVLRARRGILQL